MNLITTAGIDEFSLMSVSRGEGGRDGGIVEMEILSASKLNDKRIELCLLFYIARSKDTKIMKVFTLFFFFFFEFKDIFRLFFFQIFFC